VPNLKFIRESEATKVVFPTPFRWRVCPLDPAVICFRQIHLTLEEFTERAKNKDIGGESSWFISQTEYGNIL